MIDILMEKGVGRRSGRYQVLQERGFGKVPDRLELSAEIADSDALSHTIVATYSR